ncbi:NAD(P)H-quinone oxidoreductase [Saccharopolyspora erythraea]|uniref:NAD(P)H-quinone oxidoreductase n=1 Tax=Saccharopolyspora erythraea TaxID=1836 RepID=UPI001BA4E5E0|nr:NAD(P)H-quinone oxidoreductase [Saccharopolyspora erythraea]QUH01846.1 NAD(P)H-quinone oxidoreductase [Saccharopolyspora erythraea]
MSHQPMPDVMTEVAITRPGDPDVLQPRTVAIPTPSEQEVLVQVEAAGVNRPDVMQRLGEYPMPPGVNPTPGLEIAGEVVALGEGVTGFAIGDKVFGLTEGGGYAEYCVMPAAQALPRPDSVDAIHAAAIPETFFTVWANLFGIAAAKTGDIVLVHGGTSGIGSTALMLAKEFGIRACATDAGPEKCAAALEFGAELAIDFRQEDFVDAVSEWTGGQGVDVIVDIVGGTYLERNITTLSRYGTLLLIGFLGGEVADKVDLLKIALKRATLTGSTMRSRTAQEKADIAGDLRAKVWPALAAGRCLPLVHEVFPLERAADAHRLMESGRHIGKIVLQPTT